MLQLKIEDPDGFQFATTVIKESKTGFSANRRLLVIRGGHLYYYSSVPKSFDGDPKVLDYFHELPKSSLEIIKIKKIVTPSKNSPTFEIFFDNRNLMDREDIRKTLTSESYSFQPKSSKDESTWRFTCDNHYIKEKWMGTLVTLMEHYHEEERNIKKYFEGIESDQELRMSYLTKNANSKNPWRESTMDRKQCSIDLKNLIEIEDDPDQNLNAGFKKKEEGFGNTQENAFKSALMQKTGKQHVAY